MLSVFITPTLESLRRLAVWACGSLCSKPLTYSARDILLQELGIQLRVAISKIDCSSSFVCLGGDSLSAIRLVSACRLYDVNITVGQVLTCSSIFDLIEHAEKNPVQRGRKRSLAATSSIQPSGAETSGSDTTSMQNALLYGSKVLPGENIIHYFETYATLDISRVKSAWEQVVALEPLFRTKFVSTTNGYDMIEGNTANFNWTEKTFYDRSTYEHALQNSYTISDSVEVVFQALHYKSMDEEKNESTINLQIHHALIDGYSMALLLNKHRRILSALPVTTGLPFTKIGQKMKQLRQRTNPEDDSFWKDQAEQYAMAKSDLQLCPPADNQAPSYVAVEIDLGCPPDKLREYAQGAGITPATIFHAAWAMTLGKYVDSNEICFGTVLSGRSLPIAGATEVIGPLINTVPFCISLDSDVHVKDFLRSVFRYLIELDMRQWTRAPSTASRNYPSTLNVHVEAPMLEPSPLKLRREPYHKIISGLPLYLDIYLGGPIRIYYHGHRYQAGDMTLLGRVFANAVRVFLNQQWSIHECMHHLLPSETTTILLRNGNCFTPRTHPEHYTEHLHEIFVATARKHPRAIAVEKGNTRVSYSELEALATVVSGHLSEYIAPGDVVCVHADRSVNWIVAIYGILKAGGVYCPLDEALPDDFREQNFSRSGARLFLTGDTLSRPNKVPTGALCLSVAELLNRQSACYTSSLQAIEFPQSKAYSWKHAAYLCFTSGSTGLPKGVLCTHHGLVAFQKDHSVRLQSTPGWRISQVMSPAFDGSIHEIFSALSYGATLVLPTASNPFAHLATVDAAILTPSVAKVLTPDHLPSLKALYLVGEAVPEDLATRWAAKMQVFNMYGPTEATCGATIKQLHPNTPVTLGAPNPSTRIYILNSIRKMVPPGVIGQIHLAGVQVSQGYIGRPEETAKRFFNDLLHEGEQMYSTGDRGYWDKDGELRFLGRNDRQVKLRGFRLDLDDLEIRIQAAIPGCKAAALVCQGELLLAYVQPATISSSQGREALAKALPAYARPHSITAVSSFPRTLAGKLDYKKLSNSEKTQQVLGSKAPIAPKQLGYRIAQVWRQLLSLPESLDLDEQSDFLVLGGHSLAQLQLANRISSLVGYTVPLRIVIKETNLGELTRKVQDLKPFGMISTPGDGDPSLLSGIEKYWWRRYERHGACPSSNVSFAFRLNPRTNHEVMIQAWNRVLARHEVLRSRYVNVGGAIQRVLAEHPPTIKPQDTVDLWSEVNQTLDLSESELVRVIITPTDLLFVAHHILCDYATLRILLHEVISLYVCPSMQLASPKPYKNYILPDTIRWKAELPSWISSMQGLPERPDYGIGTWTQNSQKSTAGSSLVSRVPNSTFLALERYCRTSTVTPHQLVLAAVALALNCHKDDIDIVLGAPLLGRQGEEEDIVGLWLEALCVRIRYPSVYCDSDSAVYSYSTQDLVREVQRSSQKALAEAIPSRVISSLLSKSKSKAETLIEEGQRHKEDIFDVMVSYHASYSSTPFSSQGVDATPLYTYTTGAKFPLMVEFTVAGPDALLLRLEYGSSYFTSSQIKTLNAMVLEALSGVVVGDEYYNIKARLRGMRENKRNEGRPLGVKKGCRGVETGGGEMFFGRDMTSM